MSSIAAHKTKHASIHEAVKNGDVEEIIAMVKAGASINEVDQENKFTPLHWAAHSGALEVRPPVAFKLFSMWFIFLQWLIFYGLLKGLSTVNL